MWKVLQFRKVLVLCNGTELLHCMPMSLIWGSSGIFDFAKPTRYFKIL